MNGLHLRCAIVCIAAISFVSPILSAQDFNLTVGKHEVVESKILGEKRDILVSVPRPMKPNVPLLVVLDGEWTFPKVAIIVDHLVGNGRLPPMVVAGIVNTNRGRDLTPTFQGGELADGPSDRFLSFISDELIPQLAAEYPIGKYRILAGHSNGGMFSLYAFIRRPDLFQANIALSPSYGLDDRFAALLGPERRPRCLSASTWLCGGHMSSRCDGHHSRRRSCSRSFWPRGHGFPFQREWRFH